jgi:EAL domain-containing protein (putative c-di-GMP-specific phosphodiesterase class I)/CheY-like chemotaxis protein
MVLPTTSHLAPSTQPRVLLVDDEPALRRALARLLGLSGTHVVTAADGREAIACLKTSSFDVIVSDIRMPEMDGLSLLRAIRTQDLDVPVIFLTGSPTVDSAIEAIEYGAFQYLTKPIDAGKLTAVVNRAATVHRFALARRATADLQGRALGDRASLEVRFASALDKMWIAMQPILSWRTRSVFAYEALLRTDEPALKSPVDFVEAAERLGRTQELGRRVRQHVAEALIRMPAATVVFINLCPSDLLDDELVSRDGALGPFAPGVVLEVTERATLDGLHGLPDRITELRQRGFRIALDDLGAGYAGLSSFALLSPDIVKVDMSLVRDIHQSPIKQKLFRSFATLCRDLNTELVAEGVERAEERDCLNTLGGDLYQGYLFARPGRGFPQPSF